MTFTLESLHANDEFERETIEGIDCSVADFRGKSFYGCEFRNLSAARLDLSRCVFEDCRVVGCDLTLAILRSASLRGVEFVSSKLMGIDWAPASGLTFAVGFEQCILSHCQFVDLRMKNTRFIQCKVHEASFAGVDLSGADFAGSDLEGARFVDTNLSGADLSTAENYQINPEDNQLRKTKFSAQAALALVATMGIIVE